MQSDSVTRVLLAFIAVCMLLLLAQGAGMTGGTSASGATSSAEGRFKVMVQNARGGALLVKTDTVTGKVWRKSLTGDGPWIFVDEESRPEPGL
jgi:hypothetical protein